MAVHTCTIERIDGTVAATDLMITLNQSSTGDRWFATVSAGHLHPLAPGVRYILTLDDGRRSECTVRRNTFAGVGVRAVAIYGTKPFDRAGVRAA